MLLAELPSLRAKFFLGILCTMPLIIGLYLTFFNKHAMKHLSIWDFFPPGTYPWWDRFNNISYIVTGFILLYIGLKMLPVTLSLFGYGPP